MKRHVLISLSMWFSTINSLRVDLVSWAKIIPTSISEKITATFPFQKVIYVCLSSNSVYKTTHCIAYFIIRNTMPTFNFCLTDKNRIKLWSYLIYPSLCCKKTIGLFPMLIFGFGLKLAFSYCLNFFSLEQLNWILYTKLDLVNIFLI